MQHTREIDPKFQRHYDLEAAVLADPPAWRKMSKPKASTHLWKATLPADVPAGTHLIEIRGTDDWDRTHTAERILRVKQTATEVSP